MGWAMERVEATRGRGQRRWRLLELAVIAVVSFASGFVAASFWETRSGEREMAPDLSPGNESSDPPRAGTAQAELGQVVRRPPEQLEREAGTRGEHLPEAAMPLASRDESWLRLPKKSNRMMPFVIWVREAPQNLEREDLFRHALLNPRDVELPAGQREQLLALIEAAMPAIRSVSREKAAVLSREMHSAIDRGLAVDIEEAKARGVKLDGGWVRRGKSAVRISDLPRYHQLTISLRARGRALGKSIVKWFQEAGTLRAEEAGELYRELDSSRW